VTDEAITVDSSVLRSQSAIHHYQIMTLLNQIPVDAKNFWLARQ